MGIVSRVNPHVSPFMGMKDGVLQSLRGWFGHDLQKRANVLSDSRLLPAFFGSAMCSTTTHLSQKFEESRQGVTVFPDMGFGSVKAAVTNPSVRQMERYILEGRRMTWVKAREIRNRMQIEVALSTAIAKIDGRGAEFGPLLEKEQPPEHPKPTTRSNSKPRSKRVR